jgi:plasmid stabilization system protein ParE
VKCRVEVTATARKEAEEAFRWLAARTSTHAVPWFNGLVEAVESLAQFPKRWPLARENAVFGQEIRQMLYGKSPHIYRVLFFIRQNVVYVLHIRHGARPSLSRDELIVPAGE